MEVRKIIHIDMDYFFAQVELLDRPELKNKPVAIGGLSSNGRGVLSTCNYVARKYGVRSAMPSFIALQKCPNLIFLKSNYSKYTEVSKKIFDIFKRYTDIVQVVSVDEAYLDVTDSPLFFNSATLMAEDIRKAIFKETGLTASAGVSFNKMLAKISSEINKPDGLFVIEPKTAHSIIPKFDVSLINGVGKVTKAKLYDNGIHTFSDLEKYTKLDLINLMGSYGPTLFDYCRGIDHRDVVTSRERKSLSVERTFFEDLLDENELKNKLQMCFEEMMERLKKHSERIVKTIFIKIKYSDFQQTTIEQGLENLTFESFYSLFEQKFSECKEKVRLLGLGVKFHSQDQQGQLAFTL